MSEDKKIKLSNRERAIYNEGVRDALKEVWRYDGVIPNENDRRSLVYNVQHKVSYKEPQIKPVITR